MSEMPVSIIIPTYNRAPLIERAVRSALGECRGDDEIIVVDDGSNDETERVVARIRGRVRYFRTSNAGAGAARNFGIRQARHSLITFLDSDDEWMPGKLPLQRAFMRSRPDVLYCFTNFAITTKDGSHVRRYLSHWLRQPRSWDDAIGPGVPFSRLAPLPAGSSDFRVHLGNLYAAEMIDNYILTSSLLVRRVESVVLEFAEDLPTYEDWYCFAKLARIGLGAFLDVETVWQHGHQGPRLTDADSVRCAETRNELVRRIWAQDEEFISENPEWFQHAMTLNRLDHARALIASGRVREAQGILDNVESAPRVYRLLARLPGPMAKYLAQLRRRMIARRAA